MRRRAGHPLWATFWALLQLMLPAATAYADARLERDGARGARTHVEATSNRTCTQVHGADCALCRVLAHVATPATPPALTFVVEGSSRRAGLPDSAAELTAHVGLTQARAPPLA